MAGVVPRFVSVAVVLALMISGCGVTTSSPQTTGSSGISLPLTHRQQRQKDHWFDSYYRELLGAGTSAKVASCYRHELESLSPRAIKRLMHRSDPAAELRINIDFRNNCVPASGQIYARHVSAGQLRRVRNGLEKALPAMLTTEGASPPQVRCVTRHIHHFYPVVVKALTIDRRTAKQVMDAIFATCRGAE